MPATQPTSARLVILILALALLPSHVVRAQRSGNGPERDAKIWSIMTTTAEIRVDGVLDEPVWSTIEPVMIAWEFTPGDNTPAPVETEVRIVCNTSHLLVGFEARDPEPHLIRSHVRGRDDSDGDDWVGIILDTFCDERRAFRFIVNPHGVQADAVIDETSGNPEGDFSWNAIWDSAGRITSEGYTVEIAIPFSSLRFPRTEGEQTWGILFERGWPRSVYHGLRSCPIDRNVSGLLNQIDRITGLAGISPGLNIELDPTFTAVRADSRPDWLAGGGFETGEVDTDPGLTVKWGLTPNLILNGTLNPDFSQVEADVAQLEVNTSFSLSYPERRPFFLEGADYFSTPLQVVFTRSVADPSAGVKVSGKEGRHALGAYLTRDRQMNLIFPGSEGNTAGSWRREVNSAVLRHRYDLGRNSTLGLVYTGRSAGEYANHVGGFDGFLRLSPTNTLQFQYVRSATGYPDSIAAAHSQPVSSFDGGAFFTSLSHRSRDWNAEISLRDIEGGFRADSGFIPRTDIRGLVGTWGRQWWGSAESWFTHASVMLGTMQLYDRAGRKLTTDYSLFLNWSGPLQSQLSARIGRQTDRYGGELFPHPVLFLGCRVRPGQTIGASLDVTGGGTVDYANVRAADQLIITPHIQLNLGRRLRVNLSHTLQRLTVENDTRLFTVNLSQLRLYYNFSRRTYVRAIVQYQELDRNPSAYLFPVDTLSRNLFTQYLFSYTLNPQTVVYLGYSDTSLGGELGEPWGSVDLRRTGRTFFVKLGYALVL